MNKYSDSLEHITESVKMKIEQHINETADDFILTSIVNFAGSVFPITKTVVPKKLIIRAIQCFKDEHEEEFNMLIKEGQLRMIEENSKTMEFRKYEGPKDV